MKKTIFLLLCVMACSLSVANAQSSITWGYLQWEASTTVTAGSDFEALALVFADGITNVADPDGSAIITQIGYGPVDNPADDRWTWQDAAYHGVWTANNNISYQDKIPAPAINGTFYYTFRFRINEEGTAWAYAGTDGLWNGSSSVCKTFTVNGGYEITWTNLDWKTSPVNAGEMFYADVYVYCNGITTDPSKTDQISAQIGYGTTDDPTDASWNWTDAAFREVAGSNYAYQQGVVAPLIGGTYYYSYRFKLNAYAGAWWVYAGTSTFTVENGYVISWTNQNWIANTNITSADNLEASAEVYCNGISTADTPDDSKILAEIGYGPTADPTDGSWTWESAAYNRKNGSNMLYQQAVAAPASEGTYYCAFRFKLNTYGAWWVYSAANTFTVANSYSRAVPADAIGTVCVPFEVSAYSGVTLYEIAYLELEGSTPVQIFLDEVTETTMTAGKPYIFMANSTEMVLTYNTAVKEDNPVAGENGLVGTFTEIAAATDNVLVDNYIISSNQFWKCGINCSLPANRAYIDATAIPTTPSAPAPGRKRIALGNGNKMPTAIETVDNQSAMTTKMMKDGHVIIIKKGVKYNILGQELK